MSQMRRVSRRGQDQQRTDLAEARRETPPPRVQKELVIVDRARAAGHDEQLTLARHRIGDAVQRDAVHEAVDEPVRILGRSQRLQRWRVADQVADSHASTSGLGLPDAQRDERGGHRVGTDDHDGMEGVQRGPQLTSLREPVRRSGHGPPS